MAGTAPETPADEGTYTLTLPEDVAEKVRSYAAEHDLTEAEVIGEILAQYITLEEDGWVSFPGRERNEDDTTGLTIFYPGRIVRNLLIALATLYGLFTVVILAILYTGLASGTASTLSFLELVATVGYLFVSLLVLGLFGVLFRTQIPERLEERFVTGWLESGE